MSSDITTARRQRSRGPRRPRYPGTVTTQITYTTVDQNGTLGSQSLGTVVPYRFAIG